MKYEQDVGIFHILNLDLVDRVYRVIFPPLSSPGLSDGLGFYLFVQSARPERTVQEL